MNTIIILKNIYTLFSRMSVMNKLTIKDGCYDKGSRYGNGIKASTMNTVDCSDNVGVVIYFTFRNTKII